MKTIKIAACAALLGTSVLTTPAISHTVAAPSSSAPTQQDAQNHCNATVSGVTWRSNAGMLSAASQGPENRTNFQNDETTRVPDTDGPSTLDPPVIAPNSQHRNGGSPNIFGTQRFGGITYHFSFVEQTYDFSRTDTYNFTCTSQEFVKVGEETVEDPTAGEFPGLGECTGKPGNNTGQGQTNSNERSRCKRGGTNIIDIYDWVNRTTDSHAFTLLVTGSGRTPPQRQQVDVRVPGPFERNVVICISPSSTTKKGNPGEWRQQNNYLGECSTELFYSLGGRPEPIPSNSLPPRTSSAS